METKPLFTYRNLNLEFKGGKRRVALLDEGKRLSISKELARQRKIESERQRQFQIEFERQHQMELERQRQIEFERSERQRKIDLERQREWTRQRNIELEIQLGWTRLMAELELRLERQLKIRVELELALERQCQIEWDQEFGHNDDAHIHALNRYSEFGHMDDAHVRFYRTVHYYDAHVKDYLSFGEEYNEYISSLADQFFTFREYHELRSAVKKQVTENNVPIFEDDDIFELSSGKDVRIQGYYPFGAAFKAGFVARKGCRARIHQTEKAYRHMLSHGKVYQMIREEFIRNGLFVKDGDSFVLTHDYFFSSSSKALAVFVGDTSGSGCFVCKRTGKTFGEVTYKKEKKS